MFVRRYFFSRISNRKTSIISISLIVMPSLNLFEIWSILMLKSLNLDFKKYSTILSFFWWRWNCKSMMIVVPIYDKKLFAPHGDVWYLLFYHPAMFGQPSVNVLSWRNFQRGQFAQFCTQNWKLKPPPLLLLLWSSKDCGTKKWNHRLALAHIIYFYSITYICILVSKRIIILLWFFMW